MIIIAGDRLVEAAAFLLDEKLTDPARPWEKAEFCACNG